MSIDQFALSMSSETGKGISKEEMRKVLRAGYSMSPEELTLDRIAGYEGTAPFLARYDIAAINEERKEEIARWPELHQKIERTLDEYRLRQLRREPEEWERILGALSDAEWESLWEQHPAAKSLAREYKALEAQGLLK